MPSRENKPDKPEAENRKQPSATDAQTGKLQSENLFDALVDGMRSTRVISPLLCIVVPLLINLTVEWIARGTLGKTEQNYYFFQMLLNRPFGFMFSTMLLICLYTLLYKLTTLHSVAFFVLFVPSFMLAFTTYFKLNMRAEPLLPWDLGQIGALLSISEEIEISIRPSMVIALILAALALAALVYFDIWKKKHRIKPEKRLHRVIKVAAATAGAVLLMLVFFLNPATCRLFGVLQDPWMQDRYYRTHGVLTGFITNLQMLQIDRPPNYSEDNVQQLLDEIRASTVHNAPVYTASYAASVPASSGRQTRPDIIYVMAEGFWDMTRLPGIVYDQELMPNITALRAEAAYGNVYTPSYGGGTCDVEFEALTGFSMSFLPSGCKPFQQYMADAMPSLPNHLLAQGYDTLGIHGYGARFWNRDRAYPMLGIDEFFASDTFVNPERQRGLISDAEFMRRIIYEHTTRAAASSAPLFIHGVSIQNHGSYAGDRYPYEYMVKVLAAPDAFNEDERGQIADCATGIRDMDAAVGMLVRYLRNCGRDTILVFWGDHLNAVNNAYKLFEETGYIEKGDYSNPSMYQTPLLIWSNFHQKSIDLGTLSSYNISPVLMNLYGLPMPVYFEFLIQQYRVFQGFTKAHIVQPGGVEFSLNITEEQQAWMDKHRLLQYDLMFGEKYLVRSNP